MSRRCLFGHLLDDGVNVCPRCFGDVHGDVGVKEVNESKVFPKTDFEKSLTPSHHTKKRVRL